MPAKSNHHHFKELKRRFKQHQQRAARKFASASDLAVKTATAGALASTLALSGPPLENRHPSSANSQTKITPIKGITPRPPEAPQPAWAYRKKNLAQQLERVLPPHVGPLKSKTLTEIERILNEYLRIPAKAKLKDFTLNTNYGYIGAEQHLPRFPGDTAAQHGQWPSSGITHQLGAWGYVPEHLETYYFAVQTFNLPMWQKNYRLTYDWFKWRKMLAVNPKTGDAVVGVVADAGPADWTGKQFGGSPEVMEALSLHRGARKGEILLFFVDDPNNKIPLGPIIKPRQR